MLSMGREENSEYVGPGFGAVSLFIWKFLAGVLVRQALLLWGYASAISFPPPPMHLGQ